jgi:hypothetical protein
MKKGDLIYAPADVMLCKFEEEADGSKNSAVSSYLKLPKPAHLLYIEEETHLYEVLYKDDKWFVKKKEVYEVKDE